MNGTVIQKFLPFPLPIFSNTRYNDTIVVLKWVLSQLNQSGRTHMFVKHEAMLEGQSLRVV